MIQQNLTNPKKAWDLFLTLEPQLYKFPAIDPESFKKRVQKVLDQK